MSGVQDGVLLIDKEAGVTSFDVIRKIRRALGGGRRAGKLGHAGTLDPFATGLLLVMLGQGTKLSRFLMGQNKVYRATFRLGTETDTLDPTGRVVRTAPVPSLRREELEESMRPFLGEIRQVPPSFSAVKYEGVRAYKLARKGINPQLPTRRVFIHALQILSMDLPEVTLEARCSAGTYLRSLARDLAQSLGTVAHVSALRRLAIGAFQVEEAFPSSWIGGRETAGLLMEKILPMRRALPDLPEVSVSRVLAEKIREGYRPRSHELPPGQDIAAGRGGYVKLVSEDELVAILRLDTEAPGGVASHPVDLERVFHPSS